jgi:hypothetical protein
VLIVFYDHDPGHFIPFLDVLLYWTAVFSVEEGFHCLDWKPSCDGLSGVFTGGNLVSLVWIRDMFLQALSQLPQFFSESDDQSLEKVGIGETRVVDQTDCLYFLPELFHFQVDHDFSVPVI